MVRGGYRFSLWVNHLASTVFSQEVVTSSSANVLDDIFSGAKTHFLSTVHDAYAVTLADPVEEGLCVVVLVFRKVEHLIEAELVKGDRIEGSYHSDVLYCRLVRITVAVTVN